MAKMLIEVDSDLTANGLESVVDLSPGQLPALQNLTNYMEALSGGNQSADMNVKQGVVAASATFTVSSTGSTNGQAGSLLNEDLTAVTSGADPNDGEFNISATPATQAASMVTAIQAVLGDKLTVSRNGAVITVTSKVPGVIGNGLQISAGDLSNVAVGAFANGDDGDEYDLSF